MFGYKIAKRCDPFVYVMAKQIGLFISAASVAV